MYTRFNHRGFTIIEMLVVITVLIIVSAISAATFKNMYRASTLKAGGAEIHNALTRARTSTLSSEGATVYGVHVSTTSVTFFEGATFATSTATNKVYAFEGGVTATSTLISSGTNIVFARLTGIPSAWGTIYVRNSDATTTIVVHPTGLIEYE